MTTWLLCSKQSLPRFEALAADRFARGKQNQASRSSVGFATLAIWSASIPPRCCTRECSLLSLYDFETGRCVRSPHRSQLHRNQAMISVTAWSRPQSGS